MLSSPCKAPKIKDEGPSLGSGYPIICKKCSRAQCQFLMSSLFIALARADSTFWELRSMLSICFAVMIRFLTKHGLWRLSCGKRYFRGRLSVIPGHPTAPVSTVGSFLRDFQQVRAVGNWLVPETQFSLRIFQTGKRD